MKILRVIVDELPESVDVCRFMQGYSYDFVCKEIRVDCALTSPQLVNPDKWVIEQCPDCPLRVEWDNKKIANEVM